MEKVPENIKCTQEDPDIPGCLRSSPAEGRMVDQSEAMMRTDLTSRGVYAVARQKEGWSIRAKR